MELIAAQSLAKDLMETYGLKDWKFKFDKGRRRFGACFWSRRTISLSSPLTLLNNFDQVRDTILHEIAHALLDPMQGHSEVWKKKAQEIGAKPERCYSSEEVVKVPPKWIGQCRDCNGQIPKHRLTQRTRMFAYHLPCKEASNLGKIYWRKRN